MNLLLCLALISPLICTGRDLTEPAAMAAGSRTEGAATVRTYGVKINVDDMGKAVAFYCQKLGFEIEDRSGYPDLVALKSSDHNKLILSRVKRLRERGPTETGFSFTLQVNDLDQAIERMKSLGVEFAETSRRKEGVGNAISIRDPFGRRISLMHQTVVKVEPFREPRLYNYGFLIPDMEAGRNFYSDKLGFIVRSENYLPLDLPLGHADKSFGFMLHYRPGVKPLEGHDTGAAPLNTLMLATDDLPAATRELAKRGVKILGKPRKSALGVYVEFEDPFGNVSELLEVAK